MPKRILQGVVVSATNDKTISVEVVRQVKHPLYKKIIKRSKKYAAHDENNVAKLGQSVSIQETRPISKSKRWILLDGGAS